MRCHAQGLDLGPCDFRASACVPRPGMSGAKARCSARSGRSEATMEDDIARAGRAKKGSPFLNTEQAAFYLGLGAWCMPSAPNELEHLSAAPPPEQCCFPRCTHSVRVWSAPIAVVETAPLAARKQPTKETKPPIRLPGFGVRYEQTNSVCLLGSARICTRCLRRRISIGQAFPALCRSRFAL